MLVSSKKIRFVLILFFSMIVSFFILYNGQFLEVEAYSSDEPIILAIAGPMTGPYAEYGQAMKEGVEVAVEEINEAGGILGRKVEFIINDDHGEPREALAIAQKVISNPKIVGMIGHFFSSCTFAAGPIYQEKGLPTVVVGASNPDIPEIGNYIFQAYPNSTDQGILMLDFCLKELGKKNLSILYSSDDYGVGLFEPTSERAREIGMNLVYTSKYKASGDLDFTPLLTNVRESGADVLVLIGTYTPMAQMIRQMDLIGIDLPVVCTDGAYQYSFIDIAGESAEEDVYIATWFHPEQKQEAAKNFIEAYTARFNKASNMESPLCYEGAKVLMNAIERAGSINGKAIRDEIYKTDFMGPTGRITLNEKGGRSMEDMKGLFLQVIDGEFKIYDY